MAIGSAVKVLQDGGRKSRCRLAAVQVISNLQGDASPNVAAGLKQAEPLLRDALTVAAHSNGSAAMLREVCSALEALNDAPLDSSNTSPATGPGSSLDLVQAASPINPEEESDAGMPASEYVDLILSRLGSEEPSCCA